jgi:hypothetical protein
MGRKVTRGHILDLENSFCFFLKGFAQPLGVESVPIPKENEAVVFDDFFIAGLRIPPHPVLLDILRKFYVQLHQLIPNAIVQISKFIWTVTSYGGHPNAEVFAHHYELHYQNKKILLRGLRLPLLHSFGAYLFTHLGLGIALGLLPLRGISGRVVGIATSSTAKCLRNK